jgi:HSP20 family protein
MPTVIRRSETVTVSDKQTEIVRTVGWQVTSSLWSPLTDVYETESELVVRLEVAGMRESDFEITFNNGILLVRGVRSDTPERRGYHQMEIHFGKFSTSIGVPEPIDLDSSVAEYKDGFLIIRMPKAKTTEVKIEE